MKNSPKYWIYSNIWDLFCSKILYNESKGMPIYRNENIFINTKHILDLK